jgi:putative FmdB family regulatory protein
MPTYLYKSDDPESGCETCAESFELVQRLSEPALEVCPDCGSGVHRIIGRTPVCMTNRRWNTKKMLSDGNLKRLGFKKMVKESDGKYRDVLAD